jgi:membrane protein implicated in regulation of membrane protease activity
LRVFGKYLLLQAPELLLAALVLIALQQWAGLPRWSVYVLLLVLLVKDLVLFPFVRGAYEFETSSPIGAGRLLGARGISTEPLEPHGYVRLGGELWRAEASSADASIPQGSPVRVREVRGLTLIVEADDAV